MQNGLPLQEGSAMPRRTAAAPVETGQPAPRWFTAVVLVLALVLAGLPVAVWLDLRALSEAQMARQVRSLSNTIDSLRDFYAENVVARAIAHDGPVVASHRYLEVPGAIPIPATFSLELVSIFDSKGDEMQYRFVSDYPFSSRSPTPLTAFERRALDALIEDPARQPYDSGGTLFERTVSIATPILMGQACVDCHNSHPDSPRTDWVVGDVRAIQAITLRQHLGANVFAFRFLLIYFAMLVAVAWIVLKRLRAQAWRLTRANEELMRANEFLASVSKKVARYISPKVYRRIFTGEDPSDVNTDRRNLTIFFSDVQDFTEMTERLQPEDLTSLLNEYFTEMARIAEAHGGTLDKFVGDAVLVFFGDPVSQGVREDARAAMRMALAMQDRIAALSHSWRQRGSDRTFEVRMGLNTGYCNVGNFGSLDRMSYTIVGAEVNLAARLQSVAGPGEIALSNETYALVGDMVSARAAGPIEVKGISHPVSYHVVPRQGGAIRDPVDVALDRLHGTLEAEAMSDDARARARAGLVQALSRLGGDLPR